MTEELLQNIVLGAPNFTGFLIAIMVLVRIINKQFLVIENLMDKWERCEDDNDKIQVIKKTTEQ